MVRTTLAASLVLLTWLAPCPALAALRPDQVLIVVNDSSAISVAVGNYYARVRGVPLTNIFHLPAGTPTSEVILRGSYDAQIRNPLMAHLTVTRPDLRAAIKAIVLTKGIPLGVWNTTGRGFTQTAASVDSELTQLFTGLVADDGQQGFIANPYFDARVGFDQFLDPSISYLVFRLDGYQTGIDPASGVPADIKRLIDAAQHPFARGTFVLDTKNASGDGDDWMIAAADRLEALHIPHQLETDRAVFVKNVSGILGYCSWGSNDPSDPGPPFYGEVPPGSGEIYPGTFLPGAIATTFVSTNARTFLAGHQAYGQSLVADLIHQGVCAANGHVFEPFIDGVARPDVLFPRYIEGFQVGEAFYQSIPYLSWQNIVVADPLMASALVPPPPAQLLSVSPSAGSTSGEVVITLHGRDFDLGAPLGVTVGGVPCTHVVGVDAETILAMTPAAAPGPADVVVEMGSQAATLARGFAYTPALAFTLADPPASQLTFTLWGKAGERYYVFASLGAASIPLPPHGTVRLDPNRGLALLFSGALLVPRLDLPVTLPADRGLAGLTLHLQTLTSPHGDAAGARLSNLLTLELP